MDMKSFTESSWVKQATESETVARVTEELPQWLRKLQNTELVTRARRLGGYLTSGSCSATELAIVAGALLYLISPIDVVPDFIPFAGWFDDMAIAGMVLGYLDRKASVERAEDTPV